MNDTAANYSNHVTPCFRGKCYLKVKRWSVPGLLGITCGKLLAPSRARRIIAYAGSRLEMKVPVSLCPYDHFGTSWLVDVFSERSSDDCVDELTAWWHWVPLLSLFWGQSASRLLEKIGGRACGVDTSRRSASGPPVLVMDAQQLKMAHWQLTEIQHYLLIYNTLNSGHVIVCSFVDFRVDGKRF